MFSNLQIRPAKQHGRKSSMAARAGVSKRRVSYAFSSPNQVPSMSFMEDLFGEEFPEAFVDGSGRKGKSRKSISDLPAEILTLVGDYLSKKDLKKLRLASTYLAQNVDLRIDRVFISPNRANLNHLRKILDHPRYSHQVHEIVWDEALLERYPDLDSFCDALADDESENRRELETLFACAILGHDDSSGDYRTFEMDDLLEGGKLTEAGKSILLHQDDAFSRKMLFLNASILMTVEDSYNFYQTLYQQEQDIIAQKIDAAALSSALKGLPKVRRITLTSEVWRPWYINPIYDTPFYRSLPPGFRKPAVYPWLGDHPASSCTTGQARTMHCNRAMDVPRIDELGPEWHGYKTIIAALSKIQHPEITELIIDSGHEYTGISHQLFAAPNADLDLTIRMADNLTLKRLKFSINSHYVTNRGENDYLTNGLLKTMLEHLPQLEHLDFDPHCNPRREHGQYNLHRTFDYNEIFPTGMMSRLKTFALRDTSISGNNLLELMANLPRATQITLDNICLGQDPSTSLPADWRIFFWYLFHHYKVHTNIIPRFTFILPLESPIYGAARCHLVDHEVDEFLNGLQVPSDGQDIPFVGDKGIHRNVGWIVDDRDPGFKVRPTAEYWATEEDYKNRQHAIEFERHVLNDAMA